MKTTSIRWGLLLGCGWFVILYAAAIILSPADPGNSSWSGFVILVSATVCLVLMVVVLGTYFYRRWRRVTLAPNKAAYIAWLCFETACTIALTGGLIWIFASSARVDSIAGMRQNTLRQDLMTMRAIISQFTLETHKRPHSLDDLVKAGYLKEIPTDPMTGRKDTWVLKCSKDPANPGVEEIESGYPVGTNRRISHCD